LNEVVPSQQRNVSAGPSGPASGHNGAKDLNQYAVEDPLDVMIKKKQSEDNGNFNDSINNLNPTKTPSTAEHGSIRNNISFESHSNNLNTMNANITNFN
jgi:hypothetical protein